MMSLEISRRLAKEKILPIFSSANINDIYWSIIEDFQRAEKYEDLSELSMEWVKKVEQRGGSNEAHNNPPIFKMPPFQNKRLDYDDEIGEEEFYCKAYPKKILDELLYGEHNHEEPFSGDGRVLFE